MNPTGIIPPLAAMHRARVERLLREGLEQMERDIAAGVHGTHDPRMNRLEEIVLAMGFLMGAPATKP